jgi:chromate reductase
LNVTISHDEADDQRLRIMTICGSLRAGSVNAAVLRTVAELLPPGVDVDAYDGTGHLPFFNPDDDVEPLDPAVADYRRRIRLADAVLFSTPEYAGALPGAFKNALDWMVGGVEIADKPVAWINPSTGPTGAADAYDSLRKVFRFIQPRIVEAACLDVPVFRRQIGPDRLIPDPMIRERIAGAIATLASAARERRPTI